MSTSSLTPLLLWCAILLMFLNVYSTRHLEQKAIAAGINKIRLPDLVHDNTPPPPQYLREVTEVLTVLPIAFVFGLGWSRINWDIYFGSLTLLFGLRLIAINLTILPSVSDGCTDVPKTSAFHLVTHSCNDLSFSGHTVTVLLNCFVLAHLFPSQRNFWLMYALTVCFLITYIRNHYTQDVTYAMAVFVASVMYGLNADTTMVPMPKLG
jgi:hypothetical protein